MRGKSKREQIERLLAELPENVGRLPAEPDQAEKENRGDDEQPEVFSEKWRREP